MIYVERNVSLACQHDAIYLGHWMYHNFTIILLFCYVLPNSDHATLVSPIPCPKSKILYTYVGERIRDTVYRIFAQINMHKMQKSTKFCTDAVKLLAFRYGLLNSLYSSNLWSNMMITMVKVSECYLSKSIRTKQIHLCTSMNDPL